MCRRHSNLFFSLLRSRSWKNFQLRDPIGRVRLTKENFLAGAVQVTARQFLPLISDNVVIHLDDAVAGGGS